MTVAFQPSDTGAHARPARLDLINRFYSVDVARLKPGRRSKALPVAARLTPPHLFPARVA